MPPSKQKRLRSNNAPGRTLHNFFPAKPVTETQGQPQKLQVGGSNSTTTSTRTSAVQDVIVIDSDSDDAVEIVEGASSSHKRRKLFDGKGGPNMDEIPDKSMHSKEDSVSYAQKVEGKDSQGQTICFGKPFLLCSSPKDTRLDRDDKARHDKPFSLDASNTSQKYDLSASSSSCPTIDIDLTLDDWDNGDDEIVANSTGDNIFGRDIPFPPQNELEQEWETDFLPYMDDNRAHPFGGDEEPACDLHQPRSDSPENVKQTQSPKDGNNVFSLLMSSFKEKVAWKEADAARNNTRRPNAAYARRKAPFYKILQGMPIAVDAFCYGAIPGVNAYFLSHAHSDHYTSLSSSWKNGPIYCSEGTANLIIHMLNVDKKWVRQLPMDTPTLIPDTNGVTATLIEANHCPGSCLFFFEGPQSVNAGDSNFKSPFVGSSKVFRYLHCGDFRASPQHVLHPVVRGKTIDHVYLDTTYLDPKYTFPPQPLVISACAEIARRVASGEQLNEETSGMFSWLSKGKEKEKPRSLIVVGTYTIGKERLVKAIALAVNSRIYCDTRKSAILRCQADPELDALLTSDPNGSIVHLVPLATISTDRLKIYLERLNGAYDRVIGFRPTGWTYRQSPGTDPSPSVTTILTKTLEQDFSYIDLRVSPKSTPVIQLYLVPYSEHSSFNELTCFAMSLRWVKIIATVNVGSESSRAKMAKWFGKWETERTKRAADTIVPYRHPHYW